MLQRLYFVALMLFSLVVITGCECQSYDYGRCTVDKDCPRCQECVDGRCQTVEEICGDGVDNDCDGQVDEGCPDSCEGVVCVSPPPRECTDDDTLRYYLAPGECVVGECRYESRDFDCEQGCEEDACAEDFCIGLYCDDQNPCTDDGCGPDTGCTNLPNSEPCDDGDICTEGDVCQDSACRPGTG